jgi:hypothetical protein
MSLQPHERFDRAVCIVCLLCAAVMVAVIVWRGLATPAVDAFVTYDIAERRVIVHDLVPDEWTVCFDDLATLCATAGELREGQRFTLPELAGQ